MTINFKTATIQSLHDDYDLTSLDFCSDLAGKDASATLVCHVDRGPARQDGMVFALEGHERRYALLTNGPTEYADTLLKLGDDALAAVLGFSFCWSMDEPTVQAIREDLGYDDDDAAKLTSFDWWRWYDKDEAGDITWYSPGHGGYHCGNYPTVSFQNFPGNIQFDEETFYRECITEMGARLARLEANHRG